MPDNNDFYLAAAVEQLRRWRDTMPQTAVAHVDWPILSYLLDQLDARPPKAAPYEPKTTPEQRATMLDIMGKNPLLQHGFKMLLEDLKNAEAALGIVNG